MLELLRRLFSRRPCERCDGAYHGSPNGDQCRTTPTPSGPMWLCQWCRVGIEHGESERSVGWR